MKDPAARAAQLLLRQYALKHESELLRVLELSSDAEQRGIACEALGYARQSPSPDRGTGARGSRFRRHGSQQRHARWACCCARTANWRIRFLRDTFIEMIGSGIWTDRNKGAMVLEQLTFGRDPVLLTRPQERVARCADRDGRVARQFPRVLLPDDSRKNCRSAGDATL